MYNCGCNNIYGFTPTNCNQNCASESIVLNASNEMVNNLRTIDEARVAFEKEKNTLIIVGEAEEDLSNTRVLYEQLEEGLQNARLGNFKNEVALDQILKAYACCTANSATVDPTCIESINKAKDIQTQISGAIAQAEDKINQLLKETGKVGNIAGEVAVNTFALSEPLRLTAIYDLETNEYQLQAYQLKMKGFECCKNNQGGCVTCPCYNPNYPLAQCDELMRQSEAVRNEAMQVYQLGQTQQKIFIDNGNTLIDSLKKQKDERTILYQLMIDVMDLTKTIGQLATDGINYAKKGYECCKTASEKGDCNCTCEQSNHEVDYTNYNNHQYTPVSPHQKCSEDCNMYIVEAGLWINQADVLLKESQKNFTTTKALIESKKTLESDDLDIYIQSIQNLNKIFEQLNTTSKAIDNCSLEQMNRAYEECSQSHRR